MKFGAAPRPAAPIIEPRARARAAVEHTRVIAYADLSGALAARRSLCGAISLADLVLSAEKLQQECILRLPGSASWAFNSAGSIDI